MQRCHKNSRPSNLWVSEIIVSGSKIFPLILKTVIKDFVVPLYSWVLSAIITSSFNPGINLNDEKPRFLSVKSPKNIVIS